MFHYQDSEIVGRDGYSIRKDWDEGVPYAHNGCQIPKMPNFFMILGPQSVCITSSYRSIKLIRGKFMVQAQYTTENFKQSWRLGQSSTLLKTDTSRSN